MATKKEGEGFVQKWPYGHLEEMSNDTSTVHGELRPWPSKERLAEILREGGLEVRVSDYSVRVVNCDHFVFQEYGGDRGEPQLNADAVSPAAMLRDAHLVSNALAAAQVVHRFEIFDGKESVGYLHYGWPQEGF